MWNMFHENISKGDKKTLSRAISLVENEVEGYEEFLQELSFGDNTKIIGITGPAGSGKSTIVDALIGVYILQHFKTGVICVDPTSSFSGGAFLGDRVRMREWYNHPDVFIRSVATRGNWGGLNPSIIEITDVMKAAKFDRIIIETVGVGQNEIEIVDLADTTVVVQIPEGGDDIQTMKAGLLEIADIFAVNKCDRPGADELANNLKGILRENKKEIPVIQLIALNKKGIDELAGAITTHQADVDIARNNKLPVLIKKAYQLLLKKKMNSIDYKQLEKEIRAKYNEKSFNIYSFIKTF